MIRRNANHALVLCVAVVAATCGCAAQSAMDVKLMSMNGESESRRAAGGTVQRMLIKRASLTIAAADVNVAMKAAETIAKDAGGYTESTNTNDDDGATLYLRVPSDKLDEIMSKLARLGKEKRRNVSAEDVTEEVLDTEATLKNKKALRDRLRNLLDRAKDVKDVLAIEEQFTRVQSQIDSMESRLKTLRSRVAMSSIRFQIDKKVVLGPVGLVFWAIFWAGKKLFVLSG